MTIIMVINPEIHLIHVNNNDNKSKNTLHEWAGSLRAVLSVIALLMKEGYKLSYVPPARHIHACAEIV